MKLFTWEKYFYKGLPFLTDRIFIVEKSPLTKILTRYQSGSRKTRIWIDVGYIGINVHSAYLNCSCPKEQKVLIHDIMYILLFVRKI